VGARRTPRTAEARFGAAAAGARPLSSARAGHGRAGANGPSSSSESRSRRATRALEQPSCSPCSAESPPQLMHAARRGSGRSIRSPTASAWQIQLAVQQGCREPLAPPAARPPRGAARAARRQASVTDSSTRSSPVSCGGPEDGDQSLVDGVPSLAMNRASAATRSGSYHPGSRFRFPPRHVLVAARHPETRMTAIAEVPAVASGDDVGEHTVQGKR
jgi:hypothetical protein